MVRKLICLFVVFITQAFSQLPQIKASTDTTTYLIGDHIKYLVKVEADIAAKIQLNISDTVFAPLELVQRGAIDTMLNAPRRTLTYHFTLIGFDSGYIKIPALPFVVQSPKDTIPKTLYSDSLMILINRVAVDTAKEFKDIKPPIEEPYQIPWLWILIIIVSSALLFFIIRYFIRKYRQRENSADEIENTIPITEQALQKLRTLEDKRLWQSGMIKEYHSEITEIVRWFFEMSHRLPALEMTTREIVGTIREVTDESELLKVTEQFLDNADMVKFAKYQPLPQVNEEMMNQAYFIIKYFANDNASGDVK